MLFDEEVDRAAILSAKGTGPSGSGEESSEAKDGSNGMHKAMGGGAKPPSSPSEERDILQLDANLKRLHWNMYYVETNKGLPPALQAQHITAELVVHDVFYLLDMKPTGALMGETWIMDVTVKELPTNHTTHGTLERGEAYIIHQNLYYRKTKPPKLDGGAMDTRRSSPNDTLLKTTFSYSKEDITGTTSFVISYCWCVLIPFF